MRKKVLFSLLVLLVVLGLRGGVGIKGGFSMANFNISKNLPETDFNQRKSFKFGGFFSMNLNKNLSIQAEIFFCNKGTEAVEDNIKATYKLSYIEIPVLLKYRFKSEKKVVPGLFVGPYFAIKNKVEGILEINSQEVDTGEDFDDNVAGTDYGFVVGGFLEYKLTKGNLIFDLRYSLGIKNIGKNIRQISGNLSHDDTIKNSSLSIMVGYSF